MIENKIDLSTLSKVGIMRQKQDDLFVMRLRAVGGDVTAEQLLKISEVAKKYGNGFVHLSTRQGIEIHYVHYDNLEKARLELEDACVAMGACGPRVRVIVACPGDATCQWGIIETKEIAKDLDAKYFKQETPSKFKMAVTGCTHNCTKANENDIGVRGAILPKWIKSDCGDCSVCVCACPTSAIERIENETDGTYSYVSIDEKCINCSVCTTICPSSSWFAETKGFSLYVGGTMGKIPRFASLLKKLITSKEELYELIERSLKYYQENGRKKERFGHMIDRIGFEKVREEILNGV
ncbi:MAG: 4Fe-4S dicluster domain-containing protein [Chlorobiales bacterium]|nr:4Fe-4S dicluster domain-containing protein [Chlorobiales bacterium]